jgi:alkylation response protein AidB-like acyl-CoA dehydrogenase
MEGAYELALDWTEEREQFGRPINEFQGVQWRLADMSIRIAAAQALIYKAAESGKDGFPDKIMAAQAKIYTSENAIQVVNEALQLFGARGYSRNLPLERMARDVRMFTIGGGTAEVLRNVVASGLLGKKLPQTRDGYMPKMEAAE